MFEQAQSFIETELRELKEAGLYKAERILEGPQQMNVAVESPAAGGEPRRVLNMCANNYLGLANDPRIIESAKAALDRWGFGLASVRFICGTQQLHRQLEDAISSFLGMPDTILYSSCFDANGGLFETLLGPEDAVISDQLNHASIIDGIRLCKAKRFRYANNDMADLERQLQAADEQGARMKMIATDGVFSMDGILADLPTICDLAERYGAMVMVDDSHATGFMGRRGRGTHEHCGVEDRVDILTGTLGKALGGASGGYISARKPIVELLRQRSRPYLFSNSVAPAVVAGALKVFEILGQSTELRDNLMRNTRLFRDGMAKRGFHIVPGEHPICPIMLGDAKLATQMADAMLEKGVYVIGFSYPVVPKGQARIRVQLSAAHTPEDVALAMDAFEQVGRELNL